MDHKLETLLVVAAALALACATSGPPTRLQQADRVRPDPNEIPDEAERALMGDAARHADRAEAAQRAGSLDEARAEWKAAGDGYAAFADKHGGSAWRLVARRIASEAYARAGEHESSAGQAEKIDVDPEASATSKAYAARLEAIAWQNEAVAEARAGKLEPVRLLDAAKRRGEEPKPRTPPGAWKRFVDAVDHYLPISGDDPAVKEPAAAGPNPPAQLALLAAEVEYAFDNMEEARKRFEAIFQTWPSDAEAMDAAVPLFLQTYLVRKEGGDAYLAAVDRVKGIVDREARAAATAPPGAGEAQKHRAATFAKLADQLAREKQGGGFFAAKELLDSGKPAEAAAAFEEFAAQAKGSADAPLALYNAGVAWDRAGKPKKADADRERLIREYPDAKVTGHAMLALAGSRSRRGGDHAAAEKLYTKYLEKYPQGEQRCIALLNLGYELDELRRHTDAAARYREYGADPACAKEDPNAAARALYRSGALFLEANRSAEAREAWTALVGMSGLSDAVAKSQAEDARKRLKALK